MAMELTHVRFAHDLKEVLQVQDEMAYYAGAIYPDSRYISGIDRAKTHGASSPQDPFAKELSDFEKGWATHLLYDRLGHPYYFALDSYEESEVAQGNHVWQFISAAKVVEDMLSYKKVGELAKVMFSITFPVHPNDEDLAVMKRYSAIQKDLYQQEPGLNEYRNFWLELSDDETVINPVINHTKRLFDDEEMREKIDAIYPSVLQEVMEMVNR